MQPLSRTFCLIKPNLYTYYRCRNLPDYFFHSIARAQLTLLDPELIRNPWDTDPVAGIPGHRAKRELNRLSNILSIAPAETAL